MIRRVIELATRPGNFYSLTRKVEEIVRECGMLHGLCVLFPPSTTSFILLQEDCELLKEDLKEVFEKIAPKNKTYAHPDNAYSHILASLFGGERIIPVINGKLALGTWQEILLYEADVRPRKRRIEVILLPL